MRMNSNLWIYYAIYVWLIITLVFLYTAWRKDSGEKITFVLLAVSAVVLLSATSRGIKLILLGEDYTNRVYVTIGVNMLLSVACGLYLATTRRFIAATAGLMLLLGWLYMGVVNSLI